MVALPPGADPADTAATFDDYFDKARSYAGSSSAGRARAVVAIRDRGIRAREALSGRIGQSPPIATTRGRWANDALDLTVQIRAAASSTRAAAQGGIPDACSKRGTGSSETRSPGVVALSGAGPGHRRGLARGTSTTGPNRALVAPFVEPEEAEPGDEGPLLAELDARAASEGIDEETARPAPPPAPRTAASPRARARRARAHRGASGAARQGPESSRRARLGHRLARLQFVGCSPVAQLAEHRLLTGGLLVRVQPGEPVKPRTCGVSVSSDDGAGAKLLPLLLPTASHVFPGCETSSHGR